MRVHSFKEKLAAYTAMSAAFLAASHENADAQIKYTDIIPDLIIDNSFFNLDLNNDGIADFKFYHANGFANNQNSCSACDFIGTEWATAEIFMLGQNEVLIDTSFNNYMLPVSSGTVIGQSNQFDNGNQPGNGSFLNIIDWSGYGYCAGPSGSMSWGGGVMWQNDEKYLGLKFKMGTTNYYGWVRLELGNDNKIILKDYACNSIPDSSIVAGDNGGGCTITNLSNSPSGQFWMCNSSANDTLFNSAGLNVQWMKNGIWQSGATDSIFTFYQAGTYQALVTDTFCTVLLSAVEAKEPEINISHVCLANDCEDWGVVYASGNTNPNTYTYLWDNGETSQYANNLLPGTQQVIVTTAICQVSDSISFVVNNNAINISETHIDSLCIYNGSIDISINSGTPPFNYSWSSGETSQDLYNLSNGVYHVTVNDASGCTSSITVAIYNIPFPAISAFQNLNILFCNPSGPYNYAWFDSSGNLLADSTINYFIPVQSGNYSVQMSDSTCSQTDSIYFNACYYLNPFLSISNYGIGCNVDSAIINAQSYPNVIYNWYNDNGLIISNALDSLIIYSSGNYWVVFNDTLINCNQPSFITSVNNAAFPSVTIDFLGNHLYANGNTSYQWYLNGIPISGATNQSYVPLISGNYSVEVFNIYGCSTTSSEYYFQMVSVNPIDDVSAIQLLIDPKFLQIIFSNEKFIGTQLQLYNSTGQLVNEMVATQKTESILIEKLAKGIYILTVRNGNAIKNYKIAIL